MTTERNELVMRQLLQLAYDFSYIPTPDSEVGPHLLDLLPKVNQLTIDSLDRWFETEGREFSFEHRRKTSLRFCLTVGMGAAWFFYQQEEPMDAETLFNLMGEPRGEDAMDEYIEDAVGIWFSSESDKHSQWLALCDYCYEVTLMHYDWTIAEEKIQAGLTSMIAGSIIGVGRIMQERTRAKYEGDFTWDQHIWSSFINDKRHTTEAMLDKWTEMCLKAGIPIGGNIVSLPKAEDSFEHQVESYHQLKPHGSAGIQTIFHIDEGVPARAAILPYIDSSRTHYLIVDKVYERENGIEATISAHFADDPLMRITFYDTEYLRNRDHYFAGQCYVFDLYGMAYNTSIVQQRHGVTSHRRTALHSFVQIEGIHPEICRFCAPIQEVYNDLDVTIPAVYEVEVGIPYSNPRSDRKHDISVFVPTTQIPNGYTTLTKGTSIEGTLILMGKMRVNVNFHERPSTEVRSFSPLTKRGTPRKFSHKCKPSEVGTEMNEQQRQAFAKRVMKQFLGIELEDAFEGEDGPDFLASRHRSMWVIPDEDYCAASRFMEEDVTPALSHYYQTGRFPVMVYVTLYNEQGEPCRWLNGGSYTVKFHYGSMLPGQRMAPREAHKPMLLTQVLYEAFNNLHTFPLCKVLHKDLYYTSENLPDPIISREEFLVHLEGVFEANRFNPEGRMKVETILEAPAPLYIELSYPDGLVDRLDLKTHHNLITEISIRNVKRGKMANK